MENESTPTIVVTKRQRMMPIISPSIKANDFLVFIFGRAFFFSIENLGRAICLIHSKTQLLILCEGLGQSVLKLSSKHQQHYDL